MMEELKPCPYCGSNNKVIKKLSFDKQVYWVRCGCCDVEILETYWNIRPIEDYLQSEIARLTERVRELEGVLKKYADHENWKCRGNGLSCMDVYLYGNDGWEDAEKALKNLPLPDVPQEEEC